MEFIIYYFAASINVIFFVQDRSASIKENYWLYAVRMTGLKKDAALTGMTGSFFNLAEMKI